MREMAEKRTAAKRLICLCVTVIGIVLNCFLIEFISILEDRRSSRRPAIIPRVTPLGSTSDGIGRFTTTTQCSYCVKRENLHRRVFIIFFHHFQNRRKGKTNLSREQIKVLFLYVGFKKSKNIYELSIITKWYGF